MSYCINQNSINILLENGWESMARASEDPKDEQKIGNRLIPAEENRASSYVVNFIGGEIVHQVSFTTFSSFLAYTPNSYNVPSPSIQSVLADDVFPSEIGSNRNMLGDKPHFVLESLPAKDKTAFYDFIARYINPGKTPEPFDALIEMVNPAGEPVESWMYRDCDVKYYGHYLDTSLLLVKYHGQWLPEFREKTVFACNGLHVNEL
jgi:hypothetical protein